MKTKIYSWLKNLPYILHGVIVHDGEAQSGHFFAFVKDHFQNKWFKCSDHNITEADFEKEVLPISFGDSKSKSSAYLLIYVSPAMIEIGKSKSLLEDYVYSIPEEMIWEIYEKNK